MPIVDPHWPRADTWLAMDSPDPSLLVVGVPSSKASLTPSQAALAPLLMRERLHRFSTFHGEHDVDLADLAVRDMGNWPVSELDMVDMLEMVHRLASGLPRTPMTFYLGGDNAITRPLVRAIDADLSTVGVVTFDAHHDVRSLDRGPTNGTPIRGLIEMEGLPGRNVAQVGIHSFANSVPYRAYCLEKGVGVFTVSDVERRGIEEVLYEVFRRLEHCDRIHVDVDLDVLDRCFAPGCPGARPGGLTTRQLAEGVWWCATRPRVISFDFVEVDPDLDQGHQTLDVMAHLMLTAAAGYVAR
ncbi:MAG: agmatinase family protein [Actinobacteria bacterium]|nr:agmatinase family protein [Actinomycetota bacterium]